MDSGQARESAVRNLFMPSPHSPKPARLARIAIGSEKWQWDRKRSSTNKTLVTVFLPKICNNLYIGWFDTLSIWVSGEICDLRSGPRARPHSRKPAKWRPDPSLLSTASPGCFCPWEKRVGMPRAQLASPNLSKGLNMLSLCHPYFFLSLPPSTSKRGVSRLMHDYRNISPFCYFLKGRASLHNLSL